MKTHLIKMGFAIYHNIPLGFLQKKSIYANRYQYRVNDIFLLLFGWVIIANNLIGSHFCRYNLNGEVYEHFLFGLVENVPLEKRHDGCIAHHYIAIR